MKLVVLTVGEPELDRLIYNTASECVKCGVGIVLVVDADKDVDYHHFKVMQTLYPNIEVWTHPLSKNFSQQRNWVMDKLLGEWVVFIDADEYLNPGFWSVLTKKEATGDLHTDIAYYLPRHNEVWDNEPMLMNTAFRFTDFDPIVCDQQPRVVFTASGYYFRSAVHNCLCDETGAHYPHQLLTEPELVIYHNKCESRLQSHNYRYWEEKKDGK